MKEIKIQDRLVGEGRPVLIIAEAGVNHNGRLDLAKKMVDAAKKAGADIVKFQTWKTEELMTKETPTAEYMEGESFFEEAKKWELKYEDFRELKQYCDKKGIIFMSTPDIESAADYLESIGVAAFKIGSGELNNLSYLEHVAKKGKPMIVSTGMGTMQEAKAAADVIRKYNEQLIMLHCTSNYPTQIKEVNLRAMLAMRKELNCLVGYSDHTEGIEVPIAAAALGAVVIEKHFTLDKSMKGPDHKASLDPSELEQMVMYIRNVEKAMGSGEKKPFESELKIAEVARKSIVATRYIPVGTTITKEMLVMKRPGTGIPPNKIDYVIGKRTIKEFQKDELLSMDDLK